MKITNQIWLLVLVLFLSFGCKQNESSSNISEDYTQIKDTITKQVKYYGILFPERDSISVNLNLDEFKTYDELLERKKQIGCLDRFPKITIETDEDLRNIYFHLICDENGDNEIVKVKNVIEIIDDKVSAFFYDEFYPLDSLKSIIKKNITNFGKIESLSSSPDALRFFVAYDSEANPKRLENTLLELTKAFDEVGGNTVMKVLLTEKIIPPPTPPPPPPPAPEVIDVIDDDVDDVDDVVDFVEVVEVVEVENDIIETVIETTETEETIEVVEQEPVETIPFSIISKAPTYPGCEKYSNNAERKKCLKDNIKVFFNKNFNADLLSDLELAQGVQKIFTVFTYTTNGTIIDIRSSAPHPELAKEAERVIKLLPKALKPGMHKGKAVNVSYTLPIVFKIM